MLNRHFKDLRSERQLTSRVSPNHNKAVFIFKGILGTEHMQFTDMHKDHLMLYKKEKRLRFTGIRFLE